MSEYVANRYCTNCRCWVLAELKLTHHEQGEQREYDYVCPSCGSIYTISRDEYNEEMNVKS